MGTTKASLITKLKKKFPSIYIIANANGWVTDTKSSFVLSAEHNSLDSKGYDLLNYWVENYEHFDFGVSIELVNFLQQHGWYPEWINPGVCGIFQDK